MSLLERVATLVRANLNDLLDRAEDPQKLIKQLLIDLNSHLIQVKAQVAVSMADEKRMQRRWQENEAKARDWRRRAEMAVHAGDDDLAKQALARRNTYAGLAGDFRTQYEAQAAQVVLLRDALEQLQAKIDQAEARVELIITRSRQAKARAGLQRTLAGARDTSALSAFERLEEKVEEQELRAEARVELDKDTLETRFQEMEQQESLERQLEELKGRVGGGPGADEDR